MSVGTPVQVRFLEKELGNLDRFRREQRNPPSRAQAIRELLRVGLINPSRVKDGHSDANVRLPIARGA